MFNRGSYRVGYAGIFTEGRYDGEDIRARNMNPGEITCLIIPDVYTITLYSDKFY
jgi:hypothetical protein